MSSKKWNDPQLDAAQFAIDRFLIAQQTVSEQMAEIYQSTRDGCANFRDAFGHWPPSQMLDEMLAMNNEVHEMDEKYSAGRFTKADMDRWYENGTVDRKCAEHSIKAGVSQIVASQFVGQTLQERAGESQMRDGINQVIAARRNSENTGMRNTRHP
jgi:hypothetical protein